MSYILFPPIIQVSRCVPSTRDQQTQTQKSGVTVTAYIEKLQKTVKQLRNRLAAKRRSFASIQAKYKHCKEEKNKPPSAFANLSKDQLEFINGQKKSCFTTQNGNAVVCSPET